MTIDGTPTSIEEALRGPILILGAGGFVGANLYRRLVAVRSDVYAVVRSLPSWRLEGLDKNTICQADINDASAMQSLFDDVKPSTVFDCTS